MRVTQRGLLTVFLLASFVLVGAGLSLVSGSTAATSRRTPVTSRLAVARAAKHRVVGRPGTPAIHLRGFRDFDLGPKPLGTGNRSHGQQALLDRASKMRAATGPIAPGRLGRWHDVPSLSTIDSNTFESASGVYVAHIYTQAVNYRAADGQLEPINDHLKRSGGALVVRGDSDRARLPFSLSRPVSITQAGSTLRLRAVGASGSARASISGKVVSYTDAYPGTTVSLRAVPGSVEFSYTLANPDAQRVFTLSLALPAGLHARLSKRALVLVNSRGRVRLQIPAPMMLEHHGHSLVPSYTGARHVRVSLTQSAHRVELTYAINPAWLTAQHQHFPVVLDPSSVTSSPGAGADCTIYSNAPSSASECGTGATYDMVGSNVTGIGGITGGTYETLMNFPAEPSTTIPADSQVLGADLSLNYQLLGSPVSYAVLPMADSFTPYEGSWNYYDVATDGKWSCPGGDFTGCQSGSPSTVAASGQFTQASGTQYVSMTALAQAWVDGSQPEWPLGASEYWPLMLYPTTTEGDAEINRFGASGAPQLTIYYAPRLGADPGSTIHTTSVDASTSLGLNVADGNVEVQRSDLNVPGIAGMNLGLSHNFNFTAATGDSWSLDQPAALSSEPYVTDAEVLTSPDGNQSVWDLASSSTWGEGGTYTPPPGVNGTLCQTLPAGSPTSGVGYDGTPYVFYVGGNGQLQGMYWSSGAISGGANAWEPIDPQAGTGAATPISTVAPNSSPSVAIVVGSEPPGRGLDSDQIHLFYVDSNHAIAQWYFNGTSWEDEQIGGAVAANTSPSAGLNVSPALQAVYYVNTSDQIAEWSYTSSWTNTTIGGTVAPNTSPSLAVESTTGYTHLFYVDNSTGTNEIWQSYDNSAPASIGTAAVAPNTSPAAIVYNVNAQFVYYVQSGVPSTVPNAVSQLSFYGGSWENEAYISSPVESDTSPAVTFDSTGAAHVFYTGVDQHFSQMSVTTASPQSVDPATWSWASEDPFSDNAAPDSSPSAPSYTTTGGALTPFYIGADGVIHELSVGAGSVWSDQTLSGGEGGTSTCKPLDASATWQLTYYNSGERLDFNSAGQLIAAYDRNGNVITYTYNTGGADNGLVSQIKDTEGRTFNFTYGGTSGSSATDLTQITDNADSRTINLGWLYGSALISDQDADGWTTQYTYGSSSMTITDPSGDNTTIATPTLPAGAVWAINITRPSAISSPTTETTSYVSYPQGTPPPAGKQTCGGSPSGEVSYGYTIETLPDGNWREYCYDTHDRVYETFDQVTDQPTVTTYDANDDVTQVVDPTNTEFGSPTLETTRSYDACFRLTAQSSGTGANAPTYTEAYPDPASTTCTATSPNEYLPDSSSPPAGTRGVSTRERYYYDGSGNLTAITDGLGTQNSLNFSYNGNGTLATSYDANGPETTYTYTYGVGSWSGVLASVVAWPPLPWVHSTTDYNVAGLVSSVDDGNSNTTSYQYDADNNLHVATYQGGATSTDWYDGDGNLTSSVDSQTGTTSDTYWPDNQLKTESDPAAAGQSSTSTSYAYNGNDDMTGLTDAGGTVTYGYDNDDRVNSISQPGTSTPFTFIYDNDGRLVCTTYPNGMVAQQLYDAYDNLTDIQYANGTAGCNQGSTTGTPTGTVFENYAYTYAAGSNLAQSKTATTPSGTTAWNYYYDPLNRLLEAAGGSSGTYAYSYDGDGNLLTRTTNPTSGAIQTATYNNDNELCWVYSGASSNSCSSAPTGSYTATYDTDGNLLTLGSASGTTTLAYTNDREQTTSINPFGAGAQSLSYRGGASQNDPTQIGNQPGGGAAPALQENTLGISAQEPSSTSGSTPSSSDTYYTRAPDGELLAERTSGGSTPSGDYYYVQDANDSVVALTNSSDTVSNTYTYDPYGTVTASTGSAPNSFGFDGGYNAQGGLVLFGTRYYNPATATWTQPDPKAQTLVIDPTQADPYTFAGNDPINSVDPTGQGKAKAKKKAAAADGAPLATLCTIFACAGATVSGAAQEAQQLAPNNPIVDLGVSD